MITKDDLRRLVDQLYPTKNCRQPDDTWNTWRVHLGFDAHAQIMYV